MKKEKGMIDEMTQSKQILKIHATLSYSNNNSHYLNIDHISMHTSPPPILENKCAKQVCEAGAQANFIIIITYAIYTIMHLNNQNSAQFAFII